MDDQPQCFLDFETTGRNPFFHAPYELGVVLRHGDRRMERRWWLELTPDQLAASEPGALNVGRYHERVGMVPAHEFVSIEQQPAFVAQLGRMLRNAALYADLTSFDVGFLTGLFARHGAVETPWLFKTTCVESFAAGALGVTAPNSNRGMSRMLGVEPPADGVAHTALGDARWVEAKFDAARTRQLEQAPREPLLVAA